MHERAVASARMREGARAAPARTAAPQLRAGAPRVVGGVDLWSLQRAAGNAAVSGLLAPVQRTIGDGHDLRSNRFAGNAALEAAYDGEGLVGMRSTGLHVTIIQQALADARIAVSVNGRFDAATRTAVRAFQTSKGLSGPDLTGQVDRTTMDLLDRHFRGLAPERDIARDPGRALLEGTRTLRPAERRVLERALTTEQRISGGRLPRFQRTIPTNPEPYEVRIRNALNADITALHTLLVASRPARAPGNLMPGAEINRIAGMAKRVTDAMFGRYRTGPALAFGLNIRDQFDVRDTEIGASVAAATAAAEWRVEKLLTGEDNIKDIDREHGAVQSRTREARLIAPVRSAVIAARRAELLDIHRNWPASAGGGQINLQRYRGASAAANRDIAWDLFGTVIHEYIHTLEAPAAVTFRERLAEQRGGFVLREGMTDYFAKIVWDGLAFTAALRAAVEGGFHDPGNPTGHVIPQPERYDEWANAERAVGIIGVRNAMAAFFLGRTDLIRMR